MPSYKAQYTDEERRLFGRRIAQLINEKGWNNSELATRASRHMSNGKVIGRDAISRYVNGVSVPTPLHLEALAHALGATPSLLLPRAHNQARNEPPPPPDAEPDVLRTSERSDGRIHIQLDRYVPWAEAQKILEILREVRASQFRKLLQT